MKSTLIRVDSEIWSRFEACCKVTFRDKRLYLEHLIEKALEEAGNGRMG